MKIKLSILVSILYLLAGSCSDNPAKEYEKVIREWTGRQILFPDTLQTIDGNRIHIPDTEYTIVAYFDSLGCTGCRMKLPQWTEFMEKLDSVGVRKDVSLLLVSGSHDTGNVKRLVRQTGFSYPVVNDADGIFRKLNSIPDDFRLQTFLLDRERKVSIIGNPTQSKEMSRLYLAYLSSGNDVSLESGEENIEEFHFGTVKPNETVSHEFRLTNVLPDTLRVIDIVSSCECTSAEVSSRIIAPGDSFSVTVSFRDSLPGEFLRSLTLTFQDSIPDRILEISGIIK